MMGRGVGLRDISAKILENVKKVVWLETAQEISSCRLCKRLPDGGIAFCSWPTCYMIRIDFERSP